MVHAIILSKICMHVSEALLMFITKNKKKICNYDI